MKRILVLLSLGLMYASLALAQTSQGQDQSAMSSGAGQANSDSIKGCLSGSDANYMLTQDGTGATFKLVGKEDQLKKHVGHEVAVMGQVSGGSSGSSTAMSSKDQGQGQSSAGAGSESNSIQVTDVKMISKQCSSPTAH